jgi:hypothetical protein
MVTTLNPNANDTPTSPMPTCGNAAAITALPQPAKVSQNVPIASAAHFLEFMTFFPLLGGENQGKARQGALKAGTNFKMNFRKRFGPFSAWIPLSAGGQCRLCLLHPRAQG